LTSKISGHYVAILVKIAHEFSERVGLDSEVEQHGVYEYREITIGFFNG